MLTQIAEQVDKILVQGQATSNLDRNDLIEAVKTGCLVPHIVHTLTAGSFNNMAARWVSQLPYSIWGKLLGSTVDIECIECTLHDAPLL